VHVLMRVEIHHSFLYLTKMLCSSKDVQTKCFALCETLNMMQRVGKSENDDDEISEPN
jgi:hypothetical protein